MDIPFVENWGCFSCHDGTAGRSAGVQPTNPNEFEMSEQFSVMESVNNSPLLGLVGITFILVLPRVNHHTRRTRPGEVRSREASTLTSQWQISVDLIEEWIALGRKLLCIHAKFEGMVDLDGYKGPTIVYERPNAFGNDKVFVDSAAEPKLPVLEFFVFSF